MATAMVEQRVMGAQTFGERPKLEMRRVIRAKRERVWDAWTRPELIERWFAPGNMTVPSATADVREGGEYRIEMQGALEACMAERPNEDRSYRTAASGRYVRVVPHELLVFTWRGDWDPEEETLVTVALKDVEGGTELCLTHERFATELSRDKHRHGWMGSTEKLAGVLEGCSPSAEVFCTQVSETRPFTELRAGSGAPRLFTSVLEAGTLREAQARGLWPGLSFDDDGG